MMLLAAVAAAALVPSGVSAQSAKEVRHDEREINKDIAKGHIQEAHEDQNELREDWRAYRRTHPDVFNRPDFVWPNGYSYNALTVGATLADVFLGDQYRINDFATYRLPYPGEHRAWVRYGNDALLISKRTGRVVTVYTDFFT
jgi:Ni/Co efflux regulator RcnB